MIEQNFETAFEQVQRLVLDFRQHERDYLASSYSEQDVRKDFIDKFWMALGWDVNHDQQKNPNEQDVKVESSITVEGRRKKADYAFLAANFRDVRFFVEAKKPARNIDNADDYFQTIRYGWNAQASLSILTDFEQFRVLDCRYKPDIQTALHRAIPKLNFHYTDYADEAKFAEIYYLFSREAVIAGKLEAFAAGLEKPTGKAAQRRLSGGAYKSVDEEFLAELDELRDELARSFKMRNPRLDGEALTEATQRTLDRLVFMRFLEDKLIEPEAIVEKLGERGTAWADFVAASERLNRIYNGIIFKPHFIDRADFTVDERVFAGVRERLSHKNTPYDFNSLPVHILGSIYERFLGKVIVATDKRARVEEKPEVRKAGGVYYTPAYIVRYIVEQTIDKLIAGKTPEEIAELRFADIACGSGSFLLGVYDELLRYHTAYYNEPKNRRKAIKAGGIESADGGIRLSLNQRKDILLNNIYGVDLDAQAVEVAQLSLFLKLLEDETTASAKGFQLEFRETMLPSLDKNVVHGNSLIGWDISSGLFGDEEERKLFPMDFEEAFPAVMRGGGFDAIVGNPPYIRIQTLQETTPLSVDYFKKNYAAASKGNYDIYVVFIERALRLLNESGRVGYIVPHKFFTAQYGAPIRKVLSEGKHLSHVVHFGDAQIFKGATTYTCLLFADRAARAEMRLVRAKDLSAWQETNAGDEGIISTANITANEWNFTIGKGAGLFEKLSKTPTKLGDVADIFVGLQTSADDVFIMNLVKEGKDSLRLYSKSLGSERTFEKRFVFPVVSGTDVKRYADLPERQYILFPYEVTDEKVKLVDFKTLATASPQTAAYLSENKKQLEDREKGKFKDSNWYRFGRSQNLGIQERVKLCVPRLVEALFAAYDETGKHFLDNVDVGGITLKPDFQEQGFKYFLALLNSKLLRWYFPSVSAPFRGGWLSANRQFLSQLPIRTINFSDKTDRARHDRMVALVEQMLAAKRSFQQAQTDRDKHFYENKCAALDRQIDTLVYELYELTAKEIAIVEGRDK
ncbi:MAG: Eco57I restriction-modification methylase domain-containing protein [Acidobacteria bacterium]|nr:Eco57I restriction-modification methylase domain-containing protein [Acidobacteriota bacterium]